MGVFDAATIGWKKFFPTALDGTMFLMSPLGFH
jgi:hypothetical protein